MTKSQIIVASTILMLASGVAFGACQQTLTHAVNNQPLHLLETTQKQLDWELSNGLGITMPELVIEQDEAFGVDHETAQAESLVQASNTSSAR